MFSHWKGLCIKASLFYLNLYNSFHNTMKSLLYFVIQLLFIYQALCESQTLKEDYVGNYTVTISRQVETGNIFLEAMSRLTGDIYGPTHTQVLRFILLNSNFQQILLSKGKNKKLWRFALQFMRLQLSLAF